MARRIRTRRSVLGLALVVGMAFSGTAQASDEEWESFLLPGVYYSAYQPADHATYGVFHGTSIELVGIAWIHRNENRGPSHGRVTAKIDLLGSTQEGQSVALVYGFGVDLSLERNPKRSFLIPFFGFDLGGVSQANMGSHFQVSPRAGVYLWSTRNVFASVSTSYMVVPGELETLRGWRGSAGLNFTLW